MAKRGGGKLTGSAGASRRGMAYNAALDVKSGRGMPSGTSMASRMTQLSPANRAVGTRAHATTGRKGR